MMRRKKQTYVVLAVSVAIAMLVLSQMGMYVAHLLWGTSLHRNIFNFCIGLFHPDSLPFRVITILLNLLIVSTLGIGIFGGAHQFILLRRFRNKLSAITDSRLSEHITRKFNRHSDLIVVKQERMLAFTVGFRQPRIVLSTALIDRLDEQELRAVIEHESFHQINRDTAKILLTRLISQALWFIPLARWSYLNYKIISELAADEYAIHRTGSELGLGSAILKLIRSGPNLNATPELANFSDGSINYRLQELVNPVRTLPVKLDATSIVTSAYMLVLIMFMMLLAGI
ncbi:M56 family metallopeptidase [Cohnella herbarum]|uniref:M56 family metallopeptidase n=1 Tax=Cohnella herbarum TaxID=2728023 RepID=A0A7Z2VHN4_9BACL|nr:M56 family metallopeptidase [Cohnella herbarum]QJD83085.1 M56 family metallopeptidase [Cohnella herbarum]